jgi:hypothetical protein
LGTVADVLLDSPPSRAVGLEVQCDGGERRFLAWSACEFAAGDIASSSALALLEPATLTFYRDRGAALDECLVAQARGRELGLVADLRLDEEGRIEAVDVGEERYELPRAGVEIEVAAPLASPGKEG